MDELSDKYKDNDVEFFVVYTREPHPEERKYFRKYKQHTSYAHKKSYACELVQEFNMKVPVLIDDLTDTTQNAFGKMPNMVFVVDKEGKVAYKADWTECNRIEDVLNELLTEQKGKETAAVKA